MILPIPAQNYNILLYADDTNLLPVDKDIISLHRNLTTEVELINQWIKVINKA